MEDNASQNAIEVLKALTNPGASIGDALAKAGIQNPLVVKAIEAMAEQNIAVALLDGDATERLQALEVIQNILDIADTFLKLGPQALITEMYAFGVSGGKIVDLHKDFIEDMKNNEPPVPGFAVVTVTVNGKDIPVHIDSTGTLMGEETTYYADYGDVNFDDLSTAESDRIKNEVKKAVEQFEESIEGMDAHELMGQMYNAHYPQIHPNPRDYPDLPLTNRDIKPSDDLGM